MRPRIRVRAACRARYCWRPGPPARRASSSRSRTPSGQAEEAARQDRIVEQLSTPCRAEIKGKKIAVIIGEVQSNGWIAAQQQNYGPHFQAINARLRSLGLTTYTPEEIRAPDRAGRDRRLLPQRPGRRAFGGEAARRELHSARADLVAGRAEPDPAGQPGHGEHGLHAHGSQWPDHLRYPGELELLCGRRRFAAWRSRS